MALGKNKMTEFGIEANYWKIGMLTIDRIRKEATFVLYLYFNKESSKELEKEVVACIEEDKTLFNKYFECDSEYKDIYNACYEYCKENIEYFKDSEDI